MAEKEQSEVGRVHKAVPEKITVILLVYYKEMIDSTTTGITLTLWKK